MGWGFERTAPFAAMFEVEEGGSYLGGFCGVVRLDLGLFVWFMWVGEGAGFFLAFVAGEEGGCCAD